MGGVDGRVRRGLAVCLAARGDRVDPPEDTVDDVAPAHLVDGGVDAVGARVRDVGGDVGCVDEHLGRDAAPVEAGSAEYVLFDDRHAQAVEIRGEDAVAGARTDDHDVESEWRCV